MPAATPTKAAIPAKSATPAAPAPAAPPGPAAPAPAAPPAPAAGPVRGSLDDDLMAVVNKAAAKPAGKPQEASAASAGDKTPTKPVEAPEAAPAVAEGPPPGDDDYLVGPTKPVEKPAETKAPEGKPAEGETKGPMKIPEIRAEYYKLKERAAVLEKELAETKAKVAEPKPVDDTERKAYTEQIATLKKQLEETTATVKIAAYEQSDEYKAKFEQPFIEAWNDGVQQIATLTVTDSEGNTRKGTAEDFQAIMHEPNNERAATAAQEMFGANAFYVLAQRRDLQLLNAKRVKALNEYRATMEERSKQDAEFVKKQKEEQEAHRIQAVTLFKKFNAEAAAKYPALFAPVEGDDEGNALLERGYRDADLAFFGGGGTLTDEQRIRLHSAIRNRAAAFSRAVHQIKQKETRIAELEAELSELRGSTPGDGQVAKDESGPKVLTVDEELEAAARKNSRF